MNKWNYTKSVPETVYVACSGGVDSVAAAFILSKWRNVTLCHFGHKDHASEYERACVENLANVLGVPFITKNSDNNVPTNNKEAQWRNDRYEWFHSLPGPVVTAHTLDDAVEWYLMTSLRGRGEYMPYSNKNVIRPFLLTRKSGLRDYASEHKLSWWDDPSNLDPTFGLRAKVRNTLLPVALECEPGLYNMVKRRIQEKVKEC